jgi:hypothetical protein
MNALKTIALVCAILAAYHFLLAPRVYVMDTKPTLEGAKDQVLQGKMTEEQFSGLIRDMEAIIARKCGPPWRRNVVLVKKAVFAGGETVDLEIPFEGRTGKKGHAEDQP